MQMRSFGLSRTVLLGALFAAFLIVPVLALGGSKKIYVDKDNKGSEDGSVNHPYQSLEKALKKAKGGTEVHVKSGTYKENVTIPKDVKVIGRKKDKSDVVIVSKNDKKPAVIMKNDSELDHVTVKGGQHGVLVEEDAEAVIHNVTVKDSDGDGIHIASGSREKKFQVVVSDTDVKDNDRAGIYSGKKRNVVVIKSKIYDNKNDGLNLSAGTKAWINENEMRGNKGSGIKIWIDQAEVTLKDNVVRSNHREGVEINASARGYAILKKMDISGNGRYGVAKVARNAASLKDFGTLVLDGEVNANHIGKNVSGTISAVVRAF